MAGPLVQYATTSDGVSIAYYDIGEGLPFVWASAYPSHFAGMWDIGINPDQRQGFIDMGLRLIGYDGRGMGSSDRGAVDFSIEAQVRDLKAIVDHLALDTLALVGASPGAYPAVAYAVRHPERVSHLILIAPIGNGQTAYDALPIHKGLESLRAMGDEHWDMYVRTSVSMIPGHATHTDEIAHSRREGLSPEVMRAWYRELPSLDIMDLLPKITSPTLVLVVEGGIAPVALQRAVAARIPNARSFSFRAADPPTGLHRAAGQIIGAFLGLRTAEPATAARVDLQRTGGLVTILFTDLTSSTALTQRLGDAKAQELVRAHNSIVREALAAQGGSEIKHTGDGIMASFPTASGALECAVAIQRGVAARADPSLGPSPAGGGEHLAIHIGLNAGEPVAEERDLFGTSVQLARRICDHAQSGQILASNVVRELAAGKGFLFSDIGEVVPKGFEEPVRLYEVRWRD